MSSPELKRGWATGLQRFVAALLMATLGAASLGAQTDRPVAEVLDLSPEALSAFMNLQDEWLEWLAAAYQGDSERADVALDRLLSYAEKLGLSRLPDLSLGAAGRAVELAREGQFDVARWCVGAAERFDSGRSEISFAAARIAVLEGSYLTAGREYGEAFSRLFRERLLARLWAANLLHWMLFVILGSGALFVAVLMATRGVELYHDVVGIVGKFLPDLVGSVGTVVLLIWPILLPSGLLWLAIYWSILLWSYGSRTERAILVGLWVVLGATPILMNQQREDIRVSLAPTILSMDSLASGRLHGSLFGDLANLREALPSSIAVTQLIADLHCQLGEWDSAQAIYDEIVQAEPRNGAALLNLGVCYFKRGDQMRAMDYFQQALASEDAAAAARFNMSQTLSELYRFREAERELMLARQLAPSEVSGWLRQAATERAVLLQGGLARTEEIRGELVRAWSGTEESSRRPGLWPRVLSLPLALVFILIAIGLYLFVRKHGQGAKANVRPLAPPQSWPAVFLPGLSETENEQPLFGYLLLILLVVLLSLPMIGGLGYRLPWLLAPGTDLAAATAASGLGLFILVRLLRHRGGRF